jgi:signal transduction histidine kinase
MVSFMAAIVTSRAVEWHSGARMPSAEHSVERLEALLVEQSALRRVAMLVATDPDPRHLFDAVCEELGAVLGIDSADMVRFEGEATASVVGAWAAGGAPSFPVGTIVPVDGETATAKLLRTGRPQRVDDYTGVAGELAATLRSYGIRSAVGAPIVLGGRIWGAIMTIAGTTNAFPPDTEERIAGFAELVTAALANADARAQLAASRARILEAGYEERRRLERDLHDGAQQEFVSAALRLRLARETFRRDAGEALDLVDVALEQLQAGLQDLRELAAGIHPSVLSDRGLAAAVRALAARSAVPVELDGLPAERLPAAVETTAYFIVAEALTNAAKHSRCERATVGVAIEDGWAVVEVRDDGVGGADAAGGSGLRGLADRVGALAGELEIASPPGGGTAIRARLPA